MTRMAGELTHMRSMCVGVAETGVEHRSPAKKHKVTFCFIVLLYDQKYQKSFKRAFLPLKKLLPRARVIRKKECVASACGTGQSENRRFCALRNLSYTTRANISHEKTEQIRARIACTPAINARRAWV